MHLAPRAETRPIKQPLVWMPASPPALAFWHPTRIFSTDAAKRTQAPAHLFLLWSDDARKLQPRLFNCVLSHTLSNSRGVSGASILDFFFSPLRSSLVHTWRIPFRRLANFAMPTNENDRTYCVQGLPTGISEEDTERILANYFNKDGEDTGPEVHSLGLDPYTFGRNVEMVATVTFANTPSMLRQGNEWIITLRGVEYQSATIPKLSIVIDVKFEGFTPLNTVKDDENHKVE